MAEPKSIGNVNVLNLLNATEASMSEIGRIGNINLALVTPETAPLLQRIRIGNLNMTIDLPPGTQLVGQVGDMVINAEYFKNVEQKIFFFITGKLIFEPDVPVEDIQRCLAGVAVTGRLMCPERLLGVISSKSCHVNGQTNAYPAFKHLVTSNLTLDNAYLNSLEDGSQISLSGDLVIPGVLTNDLLEHKISSLYVSGKITCHEENAQAVLARLYKPADRTKIIPAGFEWLREPLVLDGDTLGYLPGKKLYCQELVQIAPDVEQSVFEMNIDKLVVEDLILCPGALKPALAARCNLLETKTVFYSDTLWLVQDDQTLYGARLDKMEGPVTLVVTGELAIAPDVAPEALAQRFSKIHNFGSISCTPEQRGALQSRLSKYTGEIEEIIPQEEQPEDDEPAKNTIGNVNYLVL